MRRLIIFLLLLIFVPTQSIAGTYYVDDNGSATWGNCEHGAGTPGVKSGAAACSLRTANTNVIAGDTVYMHGGIYTETNGGPYCGLCPTPGKAGTAEAKITFKNYDSSTVIIDIGTFYTAVVLNNNDYFIIDGITIRDSPGGIVIGNKSDYNEIKNFTVVNTSETAGAAYVYIYGYKTQSITTPGTTDSGVANGLGGNKIRVHLVGHDLSTGNTVYITSVGGTTEANGTWVVTAIDGDNFDLDGSTFANTWTAGGVSSDYNHPSTHNWIHHGTIGVSASASCGEGGDLVRLGSNSQGDGTSNYNTVENMTLYHAGHTLVDNFSRYNVFRNNVGYNDGFKADVTNATGTAKSGSGATKLIDSGGRNFVADGVVVGRWVHNQNQGNAYAQVTSISTTDSENDTLNFAALAGSKTFSAGETYSVGCLYYIDTNPPGNSLYSHRVFEWDSKLRDALDYNLLEGNRGGYSASNPGNDGAEGWSFSSGSNIIRYNALFGSAGTGFYFKNGAAAANNRVYNNTIAYNGRYLGQQISINPIDTWGIFISDAANNNVIKNNIIYSHAAGDCTRQTVGHTNCDYLNAYENNHCETAATGCLTTGDPLFVDPTLDDYSNTATTPNLTLQAASPAINAGTYLTQANGAGANSTTLIVDDALYFQDGTWGSSLATLNSDWISIGTVNNYRQISSINYATNTITLASPATWADDASIWLFRKSDGVVVLTGAAPDQGAHEDKAYNGYVAYY